jgi:hypothetical protein
LTNRRAWEIRLTSLDTLAQAQLGGDRGDVNVIDISLAALQLARTDRNWRSSWPPISSPSTDFRTCLPISTSRDSEKIVTSLLKEQVLIPSRRRDAE